VGGWKNVQLRVPQPYPQSADSQLGMPVQRLTYSFATRLPVSRARAYRWATDYRPTDLSRAGLKAKRKVQHLSQNLILLTDSFEADPFNSRRGARTVKKKLVHLYPERWAWTSTHVSGPARYSQFLYELVPRGPRACLLRFTGSQVERTNRVPAPASIDRRTRQLKREDSGLWPRFSVEIAKDHD